MDLIEVFSGKARQDPLRFETLCTSNLLAKGPSAPSTKNATPSQANAPRQFASLAARIAKSPNTEHVAVKRALLRLRKRDRDRNASEGSSACSRLVELRICG